MSASKRRKAGRARGPAGENLIAKANGVLCTICGILEPVHVGESGTPLPSLLVGYEAVARRHPNAAHAKEWGR